VYFRILLSLERQQESSLYSIEDARCQMEACMAVIVKYFFGFLCDRFL